MINRVFNFRSNLLLLILLFCICLSSSAQKSSGEIKGLILDQGEARIAKGKIIVEGKNLKREFVANNYGEYKINLPAGIYKISAKMDGFYQSKSSGLKLKVGQSTELNFTLIGIRNDLEHP